MGVDADVPVDAQHAPTGTCKTAQHAVSHKRPHPSSDSRNDEQRQDPTLAARRVILIRDRGLGLGHFSRAEVGSILASVEARDTYYRFLADLPVPISEANHKLYGVSSTPTIVLVDRQGIVKLYNPWRITMEELEERLRPVLASSSAVARNERH